VCTGGKTKEIVEEAVGKLVEQIKALHLADDVGPEGEEPDDEII
jgi:TATA-box binding protein (TBP) (component of TFIID and TFIIIB)